MCFGTGGVNSLDLPRSILPGTPRSQITTGQIKSREFPPLKKEREREERGGKKKLEKLLSKAISKEEREGGVKVRSRGCVQRMWRLASLTLSPLHKGPNIFCGFSVAQS